MLKRKPLTDSKDRMKEDFNINESGGTEKYLYT